MQPPIQSNSSHVFHTQTTSPAHTTYPNSDLASHNPPLQLCNNLFPLCLHLSLTF